MVKLQEIFEFIWRTLILLGVILLFVGLIFSVGHLNGPAPEWILSYLSFTLIILVLGGSMAIISNLGNIIRFIKEEFYD